MFSFCAFNSSISFKVRESTHLVNSFLFEYFSGLNFLYEIVTWMEDRIKKVVSVQLKPWIAQLIIQIGEKMTNPHAKNKRGSSKISFPKPFLYPTLITSKAYWFFLKRRNQNIFVKPFSGIPFIENYTRKWFL